ncbi:hypothetical protein EYC84_005602 [Monilinia fructicola]|uniref:Uncharacterized protein n=1 Tax=Monilinia fructicola TaxID=38448 RepID=A0A5M9JX19_MONFR|nr:hypothetical protein EYC84_005602 [Monilinia fructicola]
MHVDEMYVYAKMVIDRVFKANASLERNKLGEGIFARAVLCMCMYVCVSLMSLTVLIKDDIHEIVRDNVVVIENFEFV